MRLLSICFLLIGFGVVIFNYATYMNNEIALEAAKTVALNAAEDVPSKAYKSEALAVADAQVQLSKNIKTAPPKENYPIANNDVSEQLIDKIDNYVGWITIGNTPIDYPIVRGNDNDFYLNHDFNGNPYIGGAIFMDRRNIGNNLDAHTIIYGHYMKDGSMFTALNKYLDPQFLAKNSTITINYLYETVEYRVVEAYYVSADTYELPLEISDPNERRLTLSTCNYILDNGRMIVHAVPVD